MKSIVKLLSLSILTICLASCGTDGNNSSSGFAGFGGGGGGGFGDLIPGIGGGNGAGNNGGGTSNGTGNGTNNGNGSTNSGTGTIQASTPSVASFSLAEEPSSKITTTDPKNSIISEQVSNEVFLNAVDALYHSPITFNYTFNSITKRYGENKNDTNYIYEGTIKGLSTGEYWDHFTSNIVEGECNNYARLNTTENKYYLYTYNSNNGTAVSPDEFDRNYYLTGLFGSFDTSTSTPKTLHQNVEENFTNNTLAYDSTLKAYVARVYKDTTETDSLDEYIIKIQNNKIVYYYVNEYTRYKTENDYNYIYTNQIAKIDITSYTSPTSISWPAKVTAETPTGGSLNINENNLQLTNVWTNYSFTPSSSGTYRFASSGGDDPRIQIYDSNNNQVGTHDDIDYENGNLQFDLSVDLTGGTQYTVKLSLFETASAAITVTITKTALLSY